MGMSLFAFGAGTRACIGKNLAQQQIQETVLALVDSEVLEGARTCQERIEIIEWFNAEIKGHKLEIEWDVGS
jgi:cytochrome P450